MTPQIVERYPGAINDLFVWVIFSIFAIIFAMLVAKVLTDGGVRNCKD